jgi:release factor glutamine methyltransferase
MFVQQNTLDGLRSYFSERLSNQFSGSEIKLMLKTFVTKRMQISDSEFMLGSEMRFSESDLLYFRSVVKRLQANEPFQYIAEKTEFYGLELLCDNRALIPRPETEELVDWIVQSSDQHAEYNIVDLCAGSGCIALGLKSKLPKSIIEAWELSEEALQLITENCQYSGLDLIAKKVDVLELSDWNSKVLYDIWVSNPPYIPYNERSRMAENVLAFEPEMALFVVDDDPFIFYDRIAQSANKQLVEGGWLYFEIHEDFAREMVDCLKQYGFVNIELRKDLQGKSRMIRAQHVPSQHE